MKTVAIVEDDGRLTIEAEVVRQAGLHPGDRVEVEETPAGFLVVRERDADSIFGRWAGIDRTSPPRSMAELIAEIREMRGHDDLD